MAIDKSNTPKWMKVVLVLLAAVFVLGFVSVAANPFTLFAPQQGSQSTTDTESVQQSQARVDALTTLLQSDPESYTVLVQLGNAYYDWAVESQKASKGATSSAGADRPLWVSAKDSYSRAVKLRATDTPIMVNYAVSQYYSSDASGAAASARAATELNPNYAPAWFWLGNISDDLGDTENAVSAFRRYIELDPQGAQGDIKYAKQQLKELEPGSTTAP